ncbi:hypothetical protein BT69DRAFT_1347646 [Atractiella rhizophila]|nr:hypothetical protein BT69DRAFT_1347646 [Atractiella rhizophila]
MESLLLFYLFTCFSLLHNVLATALPPEPLSVGVGAQASTRLRLNTGSSSLLGLGLDFCAFVKVDASVVTVLAKTSIHGGVCACLKVKLLDIDIDFPTVPSCHNGAVTCERRSTCECKPGFKKGMGNFANYCVPKKCPPNSSVFCDRAGSCSCFCNPPYVDSSPPNCHEPICVLPASSSARNHRRLALPPSSSPCPEGQDICTIATSPFGGSECVDLKADLENCGMCGRDCTMLEGVRQDGVTCIQGNCKVEKCREGWRMTLLGHCIRS